VAESKRVLILSDMHCGHNLGLTHPDYQNQFREIQKVGWDFFTKKVKSIGKIDLCICNGDLTDGPGHKGSREHITTDMKSQQEMAIACLEQVKAKKMIFLRGTPFHVTNDMEYEDAIAKHFNSEIHDSRKIDVNGCILHCRHTVGKSGTAYGSITSLQRSAVVQLLNDVESESTKADIYIRSHIHESTYIKRGIFTAITTPALQFAGSSYGRRCTGMYNFGLVWLDIRGKKDVDYHEEILSEFAGNHKKEEITKI